MPHNPENIKLYVISQPCRSHVGNNSKHILLSFSFLVFAFFSHLVPSTSIQLVVCKVSNSGNRKRLTLKILNGSD